MAVGRTDATIGSQYYGLMDLVLSFYDNTGALTRVEQYGSDAAEDPRDAIVTPNGDLIVVGIFDSTWATGTSTITSDCFVARFDSVGNLLWVNAFGGDQTGDECHAVDLDDNGNIYVVGVSNGNFNGALSPGGLSAFLMKLNQSGDHIWTRMLGTIGIEYGKAVSVSSTGEVYVLEKPKATS